MFARVLINLSILQSLRVNDTLDDFDAVLLKKKVLLLQHFWKCKFNNGSKFFHLDLILIGLFYRIEKLDWAINRFFQNDQSLSSVDSFYFLNAVKNQSKVVSIPANNFREY